MGFMEDVFGGGESESESSSFLPAQRRGLEALLKLYQPRAGAGARVYPGTTVAPFGQTQQGVLGMLPGFTSLFSSEREMPLYGETGTALQGLLGGTAGAQPLSMERANEIFSGAYANPAYSDWAKYIKPVVEESYTGPGQFFGTGRARAVTGSASDLQGEVEANRMAYLGNIEQINRQLQENAANRQLAAVPEGLAYGEEPTRMAGARLAGLEGIFGFAGAEQAQRQAEIDDAVSRFRAEGMLTDPEDLQILLALLGQPMQWSETDQYQKTGIIPGLFGGGGTSPFAAMGGLFRQPPTYGTYGGYGWGGAAADRANP